MHSETLINLEHLYSVRLVKVSGILQISQSRNVILLNLMGLLREAGS